MKLTKYVHSCLVVEDQGNKVIIDPGSYSTEFGDIDNVLAVVVTHNHPDHLNVANLQTIFAKNPEAKLFTTEEVKAQFDEANVVTPKAGLKVAVSSFTLEFFGEKHAEISSLKPVAENIAVLINDTLYHPGDALILPEKPVQVLSMPAVAPWMKMSESIDFLASVKPSEFFFPSHDALLSENGRAVYIDVWLNVAAEAHALKQIVLKPGDSVEV